MLKKFIYLVAVLLVFSCNEKEILRLPFEVTKNIFCADLYDNDYRWIPGIDVILIGNKIDSIEIVYNVEYLKKGINDHDMFPEREIDSLLSRKLYEKHKDKNWLEVPDSIYYSIWGSKKVLKNIYCRSSFIVGRSYDVVLSENEVKNIKNKIDKSKYKVFDEFLNEVSSFEIESFKVFNKKSKDTFYCHTYKDEKNKFHFSTMIQFKHND